jgi:cobalt-zinc-cadmium efflux system membrane fusion protein
MKNKIYNLLFIGLTSVLLLACDSAKTENNEQNASVEVNNLIEISLNQFQYMKMELGKLSEHHFTNGIKTNGFIDVPPSDRAMVSAIMGGYVKISHMLIGEEVKKGQLLLTLENPDFIEIQQNYLALFEQLNYLKSEYTRQKTLFDEKITSEKNYLKAESEYKSTLANYNGLAQKLQLMNLDIAKIKLGKFSSTIPIYSPINGSIASVNTSVGKFVNESDVLLEIINNDHKHIELVIFEKDVLKVKEGQKIIFNLPENSEETHIGEVHLIGKAIDETNRTVKVHGHLEEEKKSFLVGMFVEAEIVTEEIVKMALPTTAILEEDDLFYVMVLNKQTDSNYQFTKTPVKIGLKDEDWTEILNADIDLTEKQFLTKGVFMPLEESNE